MYPYLPTRMKLMYYIPIKFEMQENGIIIDRINAPPPNPSIKQK